MRQKVLIAKWTVPSWIGVAVLFCCFLLFSPQMWKKHADYESAYSGTVVDKGREFSLLDPTAGRWGDTYIVIASENGLRTKRYVDSLTYRMIETGMFVVKKEGYWETPRRPGQKTPGELLQELNAIKAASSKP